MGTIKENPYFGTYQQLEIPHKRIVPSPRFENLTPGENVEFEEVSNGVQQINATGGGEGGLQVITSKEEPQEMKAGDYWFHDNSQSL